jgi:hypothetical protein
VQGSASDVVVGSGEKTQLPVGSIAGKRNRAQPVENKANNPTINPQTIRLRDRSRAEVR